MIKKIILLLAIVGPFALYFFYSWLLKLEKKKYPIVKLSIISLFLLILALGFLRFYDDFSPSTKYSPPKYEEGKLVPAENK
jgi:predicted PurR-regulated permease PerM